MYTSSLNSSSSSRSHSSPNFLLTDWKKSYKCATYSICRCLYWTKSLRLKDDHKSKASQDFLFPSIPVLFAANSCQKRSWDYKITSAILCHQRDHPRAGWAQQLSLTRKAAERGCWAGGWRRWPSNILSSLNYVLAFGCWWSDNREQHQLIAQAAHGKLSAAQHVISCLFSY